jgi:hypothetical protein
VAGAQPRSHAHPVPGRPPPPQRPARAPPPCAQREPARRRQERRRRRPCLRRQRRPLALRRRAPGLAQWQAGQPTLASHDNRPHCHARVVTRLRCRWTRARHVGPLTAGARTAGLVGDLVAREVGPGLEGRHRQLRGGRARARRSPPAPPRPPGRRLGGERARQQPSARAGRQLPARRSAGEQAPGAAEGTAAPGLAPPAPLPAAARSRCSWRPAAVQRLAVQWAGAPPHDGRAGSAALATRAAPPGAAAPHARLTQAAGARAAAADAQPSPPSSLPRACPPQGFVQASASRIARLGALCLCCAHLAPPATSPVEVWLFPAACASGLPSSNALRRQRAAQPCTPSGMILRVWLSLLVLVALSLPESWWPLSLAASNRCLGCGEALLIWEQCSGPLVWHSPRAPESACYRVITLLRLAKTPRPHNSSKLAVQRSRLR